MGDIVNELICDNHITPVTAIARVMLGLLLGLCIGAERQARRRDAGLRTFTLICLGSTGAVILSIWIPQAFPDFLNGDPGRIAAQVLTGVGFLGAGAIARSKGGVQGLTTAACIWQTSIIGMMVGAGLYSVAVLMTIMTMFVLVTMERFEKAFNIAGDNMLLTVKIGTTSPDVEGLRKAAIDAGAKVAESSMKTDIEENESTITFRITIGKGSSQSEIVKSMTTIKGVKTVSIVA